MTFHLPGNDCSSSGANADAPFSSWWLKPGLTPMTLNFSSFWPTVFMHCSFSWRGARAPRRVMDGYAAELRVNIIDRAVTIQFVYFYRSLKLRLWTRAGRYPAGAWAPSPRDGFALPCLLGGRAACASGYRRKSR